MSEMVERVALMICCRGNCEFSGNKYSNTGKPRVCSAVTDPYFRQLAEIVIAAMREPTEAMLNAFAQHRFARAPTARELWQTMIDAAAHLNNE